MTVADGVLGAADAPAVDETSSSGERPGAARPARPSRRRVIIAAVVLAVATIAAVVLLPPLVAGAALGILALLVLLRRSVFTWSAAIVALTAVIMFVPARRYAIPIPLPFQLEPYRLVLVIVLVALIVALLVNPEVRWRPVAFGWPIAILLVTVLVSFVANGMRLANEGLVETALGGITQLLLMLSVFFAFRLLMRSDRDVMLLVMLLTWSGVVVAFFAVIERVSRLNVFLLLGELLPADAAARGRRRQSCGCRARVRLGAASDRARRRALHPDPARGVPRQVRGVAAERDQPQDRLRAGDRDAVRRRARGDLAHRRRGARRHVPRDADLPPEGGGGAVRARVPGGAARRRGAPEGLRVHGAVVPRRRHAGRVAVHLGRHGRRGAARGPRTGVARGGQAAVLRQRLRKPHRDRRRGERLHPRQPVPRHADGDRRARRARARGVPAGAADPAAALRLHPGGGAPARGARARTGGGDVGLHRGDLLLRRVRVLPDLLHPLHAARRRCVAAHRGATAHAGGRRARRGIRRRPASTSPTRTAAVAGASR